MLQMTSKQQTATARIDGYFQSLGWKPFRFQRSVWRAYQQGSSGLVHSATGTGKTLAVWMAPIRKWLAENPDVGKWNSNKPPSLKVLWITPLRALAGDTENSLRSPLNALGIPWRLESRTGDSRASLKARQLKQLPTALVTTPESLSVMLTHETLLEQLAGLECVVVDEWHELLGTKRGVQTELALARLRRLNPQLRTWGISATLGNLQQAKEALVGMEPKKDVRIVRGYRQKRLKFQSVIPTKMDRFPWSGHIGTRMVPQVATLIDQVASALVFANTRSQTERWYFQLLQHRPDWAGRIAVHHGSLDADVRRWVEDGLRAGKLRAVVCTSSLDLGVDFTAVDLVVHVGSPKGVARLLQRAGRSGHQPDADSRLVFVPTNAIELVELSAAQDAIRKGQLESRPLLDKPLDVLAQHAVTIAVGGGFDAEELLTEIRSCRSYQSLSCDEWQWVLDFVVRGGKSLEAYPDFRRVEIINGRYRVVQRRSISLHRMNIGTIVSDAAMQVKYLSGKNLGTVEEHFLSKLHTGERFLFAGKLVSLSRVKDNVAYVRRAHGQPDSVPRWMGGRMPLSTELSAALRLKLEHAAGGQLVGREMQSLKRLFDIQQRWSVLPSRAQLLIEHIKTRGGHQLFIFPFEGRLVHEGLAALLAFRISRAQKTTFTMACNDYGIVLQSPHYFDVRELIGKGLFSTVQIIPDILASMNSTDMAKRQFRQIARIAGLIHPGYPGRRKSSSHVQASSNLFFDVFCQYDPENLLVAQARREVLEVQLESSRIIDTLDRLQNSEIVVTNPPKVTPLGFPLLVDKLRERVSSETLAERVLRMQADLEKAADK